jgi:Fe-S-cluster containining protein
MQIPAEDEQELRDAVIQASGNEAVRAAVEQLYREIEQELDLIRPKCEMSGRCCRFEDYGHRLFVTTAELGLFVHQAKSLTALKPLAAEEDGGGCRFQDGKRCMAHTIRPMGCRLFFCDRLAEPQLLALYEQHHTRLKRIHEELQVPYRYLEWRAALHLVRGLIVVEA